MNIPRDLRGVIGGEPTDFIVKARRNHALKRGLFLLGFAIIWNAFVAVFVFNVILPNIQAAKEQFTTATLADFVQEDGLASSIIPAVFALIGLVLLVSALVTLLQKGGLFVGTATRLIKYRNGKITIKDWEQFSGKYQVKPKGLRGDLELELRTGAFKRKEQRAEDFMPDTIYLSGIKNVVQVAEKCGLRIRENKP